MNIEQVAPNTFITDRVLKSKEDFQADDRIAQMQYLVYLVPLPTDRTSIVSLLGDAQQLMTLGDGTEQQQQQRDVTSLEDRLLSQLQRIETQFKDQTEYLQLLRQVAPVPKVLFISDQLVEAKLVAYGYLAKYQVDTVTSNDSPTLFSEQAIGAANITSDPSIQQYLSQLYKSSHSAPNE